MPKTEGLDVLTRKKPLTAGEWHQLIEARRSLIKPYLDSFTLPELGGLECLRGAVSFTHPLSIDSPTMMGDERFSLKTQGIFHCPWSSVQRTNSGFHGSSGEVSCLDGKKYIWGLTRNALWVLAEVTFIGEVGYKRRGYEKAKTVDIQESDLITIIDATKSGPEEIWKQLGETVKGWVRFRERLYYQARELSRLIETEELMLSLVKERE